MVTVLAFSATLRGLEPRSQPWRRRRDAEAGVNTASEPRVNISDGKALGRILWKRMRVSDAQELLREAVYPAIYYYDSNRKPCTPCCPTSAGVSSFMPREPAITDCNAYRRFRYDTLLVEEHPQVRPSSRSTPEPSSPFPPFQLWLCSVYL